MRCTMLMQERVVFVEPFSPGGLSCLRWSRSNAVALRREEEQGSERQEEEAPAEPQEEEP